MSNGNKYIRLCRGVFDKGMLIPESEKWNHIDPEVDYYQSLYYYNEEQYQQFLEVKSIKGMKRVLTNKLLFDFDSIKDPDFARQEARTVVYRLLQAEVAEKDIEIYFSGQKGFNVQVTLDRWFTPEQMVELSDRFTKDLNVDRSLYDSSQIIRIPGTKHQTSGLYKVPLTYLQFMNMAIGDIKTLATSMDKINENDFIAEQTTLPEMYFEFAQKEEKPKLEIVSISPVDFSNKPRQWRNCKWSLLQGNFKSGERNQAMMVLAATCRGLGYDKETTYYMCKSALKKSWALHGAGDFSKEELWNKIIDDQIFTDRWTGGQYSCKADFWLKNYCGKLGEHKCPEGEEEKNILSLSDMDKNFTSYATNFEQNVIKTGIRELDENVTLLVSTLNGLLGQPGAGKTSMALNYLKHASLNGVSSMFFSLDMGIPIVYSKMIQKETGLPFKEVLKVFKEMPDLRQEHSEKVKEIYKNVGFNFKSGLTVQEMKNSIKQREEETEQKVKLVIVDYLECLAGPYTDILANTGFIANQLKDVANDMEVCILLLLQTQKHSTPDISDPLLTLKAVKGSSVIEQSMSCILTLWREGYNPYTVNDDKFISFAVVKNRFGSLWKGDFSWNGLTGNIGSLGFAEKRQFMQLVDDKKKRRKQGEVAAQDDGGWGS